MPERENEVFSNPLPPSSHIQHDADEAEGPHQMTNDDFRKLMMTPRVPSSGMTAPKSTPKPAVNKEEEDAAERRKKKKSYYAKLKKLEEDRQKELAEKYRDRAQERREGSNKDYEQTEIISTTADYRAVAPDIKAGENYAERRKQVIQESKYLGGDMEHTHLVKGLDYALLEKVRAEICSKEIELDDEDLDMAMTSTTAPAKKEEEKEPEVQMQFKTKIGRNIFRQAMKRYPTERNELFLPGRMAYAVDLEDEVADSDIPTTVIRSKADCPTVEATTTLTTNDIVINKLTQILSYLRQGKRDKRMKKKDKAKLKEDEKLKGGDENIYEDLADYAPTYPSGVKEKDKEKEHKEGYRERSDRERERDRDKDRDRDRTRDRYYGRERGREGDRDRSDRDRPKEKRKSYFEKPADEDEARPEKHPQSAKELVQNINQKFGKEWGESHSTQQPTEPKQGKQDRLNPKTNKRIEKMTTMGYMECYPGFMESADAVDDSDDEADYTKMDQGNKKGPVGRWDFDTQEEYSDYMSSKEALPKAAFQYGVKMADGRKTRRGGPKDEKKELDREWQKIQNIISKRKNPDDGSKQSSSKVPKY